MIEKQLKKSLKEKFDPAMIQAELTSELLEKSSQFIIDNQSYPYDNKEPIFYRYGPNSQQKPTAKCPSCRVKFLNRNEMHYCSFCGYSNHEKCVKKTRVYPQAPIDPESGKRTLRGPICRLCDRKFFIQEKVNATMKLIEVQNLALVSNLKNLDNQKEEATRELVEEQDTNLYTQSTLQEAEEQLVNLNKELE